MKSLKNKLISAGAVALALGFLLLAAYAFTAKKEKRNVYNIQVDTENELFSGKMKLDYVNCGESVNELYFCLYPNAFRDETNIGNVAVADKTDEAYPAGFDSGYINIASVSVNGKKTEFSMEENGQILKVETGKIHPNAEKTVEMEFSGKLPYSPMRFGYGEYTYNFGNWYPVLCPVIDGETVKCTYIANGDPFCSECADYFVTVTAPAGFRLASSGIINAGKSSDPFKTVWSVKGENIRDFAFVLSRDFDLCSKKSGDTVVYSYFPQKNGYGEAALEYACDALECFNEKYGKYPYSTLSVVASDFYIGGMEYPNLVMINKEFYEADKTEALEEIVVHEVAHQWWYGMVGNNEIKEAWLDEGLTEYSVGVYYEEKYGRERYESFMRQNESYCKVIFRVMENMNGSAEKKITRAGNEFEHWLLYDAVTYDATALMLDSLRTCIGQAAFENGMRLYFENNKYSVADGEKFIRDMNEGSKKNAEDIIRPWLEGNVYWG